jgi:uncharacterized RDD family membrane protein YckC
MTYCTNCGAGNQDGAQFCVSCGQRMGGGVPAVPTPIASDAPPAYPLQIAVPVATPVATGWPPGAIYAVWADRVIGYVIDSLLVGAGMGILYLFAGALLTTLSGFGGQSLGSGMCCMLICLFPLAMLLVGLYNRVYLVATRGASIGQGLMRLKVVDGNGNLLSMGTAFIRLLAQVALNFVPVVGPLLDLLWPLWDERRQTLHDKAVGSYVLKLQ